MEQTVNIFYYSNLFKQICKTLFNDFFNILANKLAKSIDQNCYCLTKAGNKTVGYSHTKGKPKQHFIFTYKKEEITCSPSI